MIYCHLERNQKISNKKLMTCFPLPHHVVPVPLFLKESLPCCDLIFINNAVMPVAEFLMILMGHAMDHRYHRFCFDLTFYKKQCFVTVAEIFMILMGHAMAHWYHRFCFDLAFKLNFDFNFENSLCFYFQIANDFIFILKMEMKFIFTFKIMMRLFISSVTLMGHHTKDLL